MGVISQNITIPMSPRCLWLLDRQEHIILLFNGLLHEVQLILFFEKLLLECWHEQLLVLGLFYVLLVLRLW